MVACVLIPRFELIAACSGDWGLLRGVAALAPEVGGLQVVGQTSRAAEEGFGIRPGMRIGEAISRCPEIKLVPPDPVRAESLWEGVLKGLEAIGAEVESGRAGEAFFAVEGLLRLYGGLEGLFAATRRAAAKQRALNAAVRLSAAPTRFAARLAAILGEGDSPEPRGKPDQAGRTGADGSPSVIVPGELASFLHPLPVSALAHEPSLDVSLIRDLERLGLDTLGALAALPAAQIADRFGKPGLRALSLARGEPERLAPRDWAECMEQSLKLPDSLDGSQLEYALELLIDRFLAMPERQGRMLRSLALSATLAGGGSWRHRIALNQPSGNAETLRLALSPHLGSLPGPADSLTLRALELGATAAEQPALAPSPEEHRRARIREAVRQTRASAGPDSLLRILTLDPNARLPERRLTLTPYEPP